MKIRITGALILLLAVAFLKADKLIVSAESQPKRIRFQITTIGESANERTVLAQTTIEGLPGTDFNINLQTGNFKLEAHFLTDLISDNQLKIRAQLDTRRLYGYSPINLPLYEEDNQKQIFELGFNETIVMLPFGRNGGAETLKIEITPSPVSVVKTNEDTQKLTINFDKPLPSGEIYIEAAKIPHRFEVEAVLTADGREIARGKAQNLLEEENEIILQPVDKAENQAFAAKLTIDKFSRNRPKDLIGIKFDFYRPAFGSENQTQMIISNGAGIGAIDDEIAYQADSINLPGDKKYELKFKIRLAEDKN